MVKFTERNKYLPVIIFSFLLVFFYSCSQPERPNILFILADDLGYSDLSCYGGEINTPNIDDIAKSGLMFTRYYTSPMCVTTRVALLSGMEYMAAGGVSFPNGISIAKLLRESGYATSMVGKNHGMNNFVTGNTDTDYGFDRFYGFSGGEINCFTGEGNAIWQYNGKIFPDTELPEDFYTTKNFTDSAIVFMEEAINSGKPFFSYIAYNAPHTPLHAPERNVRKYYDPKNNINAFEKGWEQLRKERQVRMKEIGLVEMESKLSDPGTEIPDWDLLPDTSYYPWELQKNFESFSRAAYAGMVDNMDENIGTIISFLRDPNGDGKENDSRLENTIIIFASDNGGCYAGLYTPRDVKPWDRSNYAFTNNYGWGTLSNTPFRYYKHASHEGAIRSPLIIRWPEGIKIAEGTLMKQMVRLWDFYPTFLELAGASYPEEGTVPGKTFKPLMGESLLPLFTDRDHETEEYFVSEYGRSQGIIKGKWKIANYWDGPFELFNLENDPTETTDLSDKEPEIYSEMIKIWDSYTQEHGFSDNLRWNIPPGSKKRGWGYEFKVRGFEASTPENMADDIPLDTKLSLQFAGEIDLQNTEGKMIRLQKYGTPGILWSADPDEKHTAQGNSSITFEDFPELESGGHYYITWDNGWLRYKNGNKYIPIPPIQEAAWAFRFKTMH